MRTNIEFEAFKIVVQMCFFGSIVSTVPKESFENAMTPLQISKVLQMGSISSGMSGREVFSTVSSAMMTTNTKFQTTTKEPYLTYVATAKKRDTHITYTPYMPGNHPFNFEYYLYMEPSNNRSSHNALVWRKRPNRKPVTELKTKAICWLLIWNLETFHINL